MNPYFISGDDVMQKNFPFLTLKRLLMRDFSGFSLFLFRCNKGVPKLLPNVVKIQARSVTFLTFEEKSFYIRETVVQFPKNFFYYVVMVIRLHHTPSEILFWNNYLTSKATPNSKSDNPGFWNEQELKFIYTTRVRVNCRKSDFMHSHQHNCELKI